MDKNYIPSLGVSLPKLAFGCMRLPLKNEEIDFDEAKKMIHHAMENGLNYFDTAYNYHGGKSETFLGEVLPEFPRESYFLTSKLPVWKIKEQADAEKLFNEQLNNCKTDYFDFYLLHSLNDKSFDTVEKFNLYDFLVQKKSEGKIKHIGFSFHDTNAVLQKIVDAHKWDFTQLQINYWDWNENDAKGAYDILEQKGIPCLVMEPVRGGFLAGFAPNVENLMKDFSPTASTASWALRWVASLPNVAIVLSGMSTMGQLNDNLHTMSDFKPISEAESQIIDKVVEELRKIKPVPCTGCRYCMECHSGVNIPDIFEIYNDYKKTENVNLAVKEYFKNMPAEKRADNCIKCNACSAMCPQHIDIPHMLESIHAELLDISK